MNTLIKIFKVIIELAKDFDLDVSTTEDGKIMICFEIDPSDPIKDK